MTSKEKFETKEKAEEHLKFIGSTKVENSEKEIGNKTFAIIQKTPFGSTKIAEWDANSAEEAVREFEHANPAYANGKKGKIVANKKTGNADPSTEMRNEYNAEIQRLTKKAEQLRRMGQGRSAMEIEKQIEKLGKEMRELGNKKVGNAFDAGIHLTIRYNGKEEEVKVLKDMPTSVVVKGQNGAVVEIKKVDLDVLKVHNETKCERKFGKVMGEFEEGALKTPQGKTVTDPAQAKAIAYSEADKVDNLKRARNAMKK